MGNNGYKFFCLFAIIATTCGLPRINDQNAGDISAGTENVVTSVLRAKFDTKENLVFAPFGYASILAMLGEGARGETQTEIRKFLHLSENTKAVRDVFRGMIARYGGDEPAQVPQFKTWFYVYRNNNVAEDYITTLRDDYLVEVKTIERDFYDFDAPAVAEEEPAVVVAQPAAEAVADPQPGALREGETKLSPVPIEPNEDTFDAVHFDGKTLAADETQPDIEEIIKQKECSRFDEAVDDQQYVEVQKLRDENAAAAAAVAAAQPEDNETVHPIEKLEEKKKIEKIDETLKRLEGANEHEGEEEGVLQVAKKHPVTKKFQAPLGRALDEEINDVSSALSGSSLTGRKEGDAENGARQESKMLLFNGLYYRGKWKTPFQRLRSEVGPGNVFYLQDEPEPMEVAMMRSRGQFKTGFSDAHKAQIIELPYENERYAMLVVMPSERDNGLRGLVDRLDYGTLKQLSAELKLRTVDLSLPKFSVETTSTVHKEFAEMGLSTLFSDAADLSGITGEQRLRVDELVQHVSMRVDEGASTENSLSASNTLPRKGAKAADAAVVVEELSEPGQQQEDVPDADTEVFMVDRPFLFFVRDQVDDVTLVAGLINKPRGPQLFAELVTQDRATAEANAPVNSSS